MLRYLLSKRLDAEERRLGVPLEYARYILRTSLSAFAKYAMFMPMARHRERLPADALFTARLVATVREDCGTCVQIVVNNGRKARVPADVIHALLAGRVEALPEHLRQVHRFTMSVLDGNDGGELREEIRRRYGDEGLIDLAFAVATARVFPTTKRVLGYAISCSRVQVQV
jgi:hypothetical protein